MTENLNNSSVIEDIDLPLYKYGLIHKQNINNFLVTDKQKKFQKFKSYSLTAIMLAIITLLFLQLRIHKNPNYPLFHYDLFNYFGGLTQFVYVIPLFGAIMSLRLLHLFNYSDQTLYKWLDIIKVLKGLENMNSIGLENNKDYETFVKRIKFFKHLIDITIKLTAFLSYFLFLMLSILVSKTIQSAFFGLLNALFNWLWNIYTFSVQLYSFLYYFMSCYYFRFRFKILNDSTSRNSKLPVVKLTARIIREHNNICNDILKYDKFWKSFYFVLTYTIIPINLMLLQQLLLDDIVLTATLIYSFVGVVTLFSHIILNLISASVNKNASKSHKFLFKFQIKFLSSINVRQRIKV
jgi:hypothetical protein